MNDIVDLFKVRESLYSIYEVSHYTSSRIELIVARIYNKFTLILGDDRF